MAIREYKCLKGHTIEKIVTGDGRAKITCPYCGSKADRVEWSTPSPPKLVKGIGGFYKPSKED